MTKSIWSVSSCNTMNSLKWQPKCGEGHCLDQAHMLLLLVDMLYGIWKLNWTVWQGGNLVKFCLYAIRKINLSTGEENNSESDLMVLQNGPNSWSLQYVKYLVFHHSKKSLPWTRDPASSLESQISVSCKKRMALQWCGSGKKFFHSRVWQEYPQTKKENWILWDIGLQD